MYTKHVGSSKLHPSIKDINNNSTTSNSSMFRIPNKRAWHPTKDAESSRLSASSGWHLAAAVDLPRTRGSKRLVDANANANAPSTPLEISLDTTATAVSSLTPSDGEECTPLPTKKTKPSFTRAIFELDSLKQSFERHACCPTCGSGLIASFPTCCLATGLRLQCSNEFCNFVDVQRPKLTADIPLPDGSGSPLIERSTDYAIIILYVLGFLTSGDGGVEAGRLLGLLGLPNSTTMEKRSFTIIEKRIGPMLQDLCKDILLENLDEEVAIYYGDETDNNGNVLFDLWKQRLLPRQQWPRLTIATDMGWQKRSSGRNYNSLSGHALFVATLTRKPICLATINKVCRYCKMWHIKHPIDVPVPDHYCVVNHQGSSGSMEALAVLDMYIRLCRDNQVTVETLVTDDDSTIKAKLKWSNADYMLNNNTDVLPTIINSNGNVVTRPDCGGVPRDMPEPSYLADPNHRKKTLKGDLYRLEKKVVAVKKTMTKCDCIRISTNFAYMARTLPTVPKDQFVDRGQAVLEHHFDNHQHCGSFCHRKDEDDEQRKASTKFYRNKEKDQDLYTILQATLARFVTEDALLEVGHGMDTLVNESLNNTISWLAPKNKTYSTSQSLMNRISVAVGINGVGTYAYFTRLFQLLHIQMTDDISHYLKMIDSRRTYRINKAKETDQKKHRQEKFHDKLKEHSETAKKEYRRREGSVYEPGIGMGCCQPVQKKGKSKGRHNPDAICSKCNQPGHARPTNKLCKYYKPRKNKRATAKDGTTDDDSDKDAQLLQDAKEQDLMDSMPFIDNDSDDEFFDSFDNEDDMDDDDDDDVETGNI